VTFPPTHPLTGARCHGAQKQADEKVVVQQTANEAGIALAERLAGSAARPKILLVADSPLKTSRSRANLDVKDGPVRRALLDQGGSVVGVECEMGQCTRTASRHPFFFFFFFSGAARSLMVAVLARKKVVLANGGFNSVAFGEAAAEELIIRYGLDKK
jgi:hypothetical protein